MDYKGVAVATMRDILASHNRTLEELGATLDARLLNLARTTMPIDWVSIQDGSAIYSAAAGVLYPERPLPVALYLTGHEGALLDLRGIYKTFLRIASVPFVVKRSADLWGKYHRVGRASAVETGPKAAVFKLEDYPHFPEPMCHLTAGYISGTVELTGSHDVSVKHARVGDALHWTITWR